VRPASERGTPLIGGLLLKPNGPTPRTPVTNLKAPGSGALGSAGASGAPTARVKACGVGGGVMADDDENR